MSIMVDKRDNDDKNSKSGSNVAESYWEFTFVPPIKVSDTNEFDSRAQVDSECLSSFSNSSSRACVLLKLCFQKLGCLRSEILSWNRNFFYFLINYYCTILDPAYSHPLPQARFYERWCMFLNENMYTRLYCRRHWELNTWSTHFEEAKHNIPLARLSARTRITQGKHGVDAVIILFGQYILVICAFFLHNWTKCTYSFVKNVC